MSPRFRVAGEGLQLDLGSVAGLQAALDSGWADFSWKGPPGLVLDVEPLDARGQSVSTVFPELAPGPDGTARIVGADFEAVISRDRTRVQLRTSPRRFGVDAVVMLLLAERLLAEGGLLVHSVGVAATGGAALFTGPSGAGKSTLGRCAQEGGLTLLADEMVAVRPVATGFEAHGTPWHVGSPVSAPLKVVGVLAHRPAHELRDHPPAEVLRVLMANTLLPSEDAAVRAAAFRNATRLVQSARTVELGFAPDPTVARVLREALGG